MRFLQLTFDPLYSRFISIYRSNNVLGESNLNTNVVRAKRKAEHSPIKNDRVKRSALGNLTNAVATKIEGLENQGAKKSSGSSNEKDKDKESKKESGIARFLSGVSILLYPSFLPLFLLLPPFFPFTPILPYFPL